MMLAGGRPACTPARSLGDSAFGGKFLFSCSENDQPKEKEAKNGLQKACETGDPAKIKLMALEDPDLELLWGGWEGLLRNAKA